MRDLSRDLTKDLTWDLTRDFTRDLTRPRRTPNERWRFTLFVNTVNGVGVFSKVAYPLVKLPLHGKSADASVSPELRS